MIPRNGRLPRDSFGAGWKEEVRTPYFSLKGRANGGKKKRIGVVAGVSVSKSAVRRNFWKRQAKTALVGYPAEGKDIIMIISPRVRSLTKKQFNAEVAKALVRFFRA